MPKQIQTHPLNPHLTPGFGHWNQGSATGIWELESGIWHLDLGTGIRDMPPGFRCWSQGSATRIWAPSQGSVTGIRAPESGICHLDSLESGICLRDLGTELPVPGLMEPSTPTSFGMGKTLQTQQSPSRICPTHVTSVDSA